jgi:hypothetical protein
VVDLLVKGLQDHPELSIPEIAAIVLTEMESSDNAESADEDSGGSDEDLTQDVTVPLQLEDPLMDLPELGDSEGKKSPESPRQVDAREKLRRALFHRPPKARKMVEYNQLADVDISITAKTFEDFQEKAHQLYLRIKENCASRGEVWLKAIVTPNAVKYALYGPGLVRPMEIFRIFYSPLKMVKKFHVNCVKMYYDGAQVLMFRACLASLLTGVGDYYDWWSCNKIPTDVLMKYEQRGISIIHNRVERLTTSNYVSSDDRWSPILRELKIDPANIYCAVSHRHPFFKPSMFDSGVRKTLRPFPVEAGGFSAPLVTSDPEFITKFGSVLVKDDNQTHPPNMSHVVSALDCMDQAGDAVLGYDSGDDSD